MVIERTWYERVFIFASCIIMTGFKTNKNIAVSVIVPCYKRVRQTVRTLNLIFNSEGWRKLYDAEVVVADSTRDCTLKNVLCSRFKEKKERGEFFYLKPKKIGISVNKNAGARKARFPILIFCDSDIEVKKETILKTLLALKKNQKAAGLTGRVIWKTGEMDGKTDRPRREDRMLRQDNTLFLEAIYSRYFATYKQVFQDVGGYDEKVFNMRGEGADLSTRYWRSGYPLVYEPSLQVFHRADAPDSIALRIKDAAQAIAKDYFLLAYKYGNLAGQGGENFSRTVALNFKQFKGLGYLRFLEGINKYWDFISKAKKLIDQQRVKDKPLYDFQFLEIFSQKEKILKCLKEAQAKLRPIRKKAGF